MFHRTCGQAALGLLLASAELFGADERPRPAPRKGIIVSIPGTIDSARKNTVMNRSRAAARDGAEVIIYDLQAAHSTDFGPCYDLAKAIAELGGTVRKTVAYVSKPLSGHAVLVALACDEIVMHQDAKIGDVYRDQPEGGSEAELGFYRQIGRDQGHGEWIVLAMADWKLELLEVETVTGKRFVPADQFEEFARTAHLPKQARPTVVKRAGELLFLGAADAKQYGLSRRTVSSRQEVAAAYELPERTGSVDVLSMAGDQPILLILEGAIDNRMYRYVLRRLREVRQTKNALLFVQVDSTHGDAASAASIGTALRDLREQGVKTVAWVPTQAKGPAALVLFACGELVMAPEAEIGDFRKDNATAKDYRDIAETAAHLAQNSMFPDAFVRGFIDPSATVYEVRSKREPRLHSYRTGEQLETDEQWEKARPGPLKAAGEILTMDGRRAVAVEVAVGLAPSFEALTKLYAVSEEQLRILQPNWLDELVDAISSPGGKFFLLTVAVLCLALELHLPGFGIPGLVSLVCFVLFFWANFLNETANSLEIVLFLLGLGLVGVELFVLPGFGIIGLAGSLLVIGSLVLAGQSSPVPEPKNLLVVAASLIVVLAGALALGRYLPRLPLLNRLMLPTREDFNGLDSVYPEAANMQPASAQELLGRQGVALSPLRPAGRMQLDGRFYDVVSEGPFIESGTPVEVIKVVPNRIVVREKSAS